MIGRLQLALIIVAITFSCLDLKAQNIFDFEDEEVSFESQYNIHDPLEKVNRKIFGFNYIFDKYGFRPASKLYGQHVPKPLQLGIRNFNTNLYKPLSSLTSLIMLDYKNAAYNLRSFVINTSFGLFGLFNVSYYFKSNESNQNFTTLLNHYEVPQGIYLVIPFIGPQTTRNFSGLVFDTALNPSLYDYNHKYRDILGFTTSITTSLDIRYQNFDIINNIYDDSFDSYITMRNIYYQMQ